MSLDLEEIPHELLAELEVELSLLEDPHEHEWHGDLVVAKATPKSYSVLRQIARNGEPSIRRMFLEAIGQVQDGTSIAAVRAAIERGDLDAAVDAVPWKYLEGDQAREQLTNALHGVFNKAGTASAGLIKKVDPFTFTITDPRWREYVAEHAASKVVEIGGKMKLAVRESIVRMADRGLNAQQTAVAIKDTNIGLFDRWSRAVDNYRAGLMISGMKLSDVDHFTAQYHQRLLNARVLQIGRTEAQFMAAQGKRASWEQAAEDEFYDRASAQREWIASPRACEKICAPLDGKRVGMDEPFGKDPYGEDIMDEPAHTNCSCSTELVV